MCGGQVLIATCSRVGHVFRKVSPYSWPGGVVKILNHNTMRTVEVWMDHYKNFFYKINPSKVFFCFRNSSTSKMTIFEVFSDLYFWSKDLLIPLIFFIPVFYLEHVSPKLSEHLTP